MRTDGNSGYQGVGGWAHPGQPGAGSPGSGPRADSPRPRAQSRSASPLDNDFFSMPPPHGRHSDRDAFAGAHAFGAGATRNGAWQYPGNGHAQWSGPYPGMGGLGSPYGPSYRNTMQQPGKMPGMRIMQAIMAGSVGLAMASFDPVIGLVAGLGMFAESEMVMHLGQKLQNEMNGMSNGGQRGNGANMPFMMPYPGFNPYAMMTPPYGMGDPYGMGSNGDPSDPNMNHWIGNPMMGYGMPGMGYPFGSGMPGMYPLWMPDMNTGGTTQTGNPRQGSRDARFAAPSDRQVRQGDEGEAPGSVAVAAWQRLLQAATTNEPWHAVFGVDPATATRAQVQMRYLKCKKELETSPDLDPHARRTALDLLEKFNQDAQGVFAARDAQRNTHEGPRA